MSLEPVRDRIQGALLESPARSSLFINIICIYNTRKTYPYIVYYIIYQPAHERKKKKKKPYG